MKFKLNKVYTHPDKYSIKDDYYIPIKYACAIYGGWNISRHRKITRWHDILMSDSSDLVEAPYSVEQLKLEAL